MDKKDIYTTIQHLIQDGFKFYYMRQDKEGAFVVLINSPKIENFSQKAIDIFNLHGWNVHQVKVYGKEYGAEFEAKFQNLPLDNSTFNCENIN